MNNISDAAPGGRPLGRRRRRIYFFVAALATVGVVLATLTMRTLMPDGMEAKGIVEIRDFLPPLITLADAQGKEIERVEVHYRQKSLFSDVIRVEEGGPFIKASLWQKLRANGEFSVHTPKGFTYKMPHGDYQMGRELTNVRVVFRITPVSQRLAGKEPLERLSFASDQLDLVDGRKVWKP